MEGHLATLEHGAVHLVHAIDLALLVAGLLDVALVDDDARPELEPGDGRFKAGDLFLLGDVVLLLAQERQLLLGGVGGVVALPDAQPGGLSPDGLHLGDLADGLVEEVAVMGDDDDGTVESGEDSLELRLAGEVQVVVRFVEEEQVGFLKEAAREADHLALATTEQIHWPVPGVLFEAEVAEEALGAVAEHGATGAIELLEEGGVLSKQAIEAVGVREHVRAGHAGFGGLDALFERGEVLAARKELGEARRPGSPAYSGPGTRRERRVRR
jgi:hypothetical protein